MNNKDSPTDAEQNNTLNVLQYSIVKLKWKFKLPLAVYGVEHITAFVECLCPDKCSLGRVYGVWSTKAGRQVNIAASNLANKMPIAQVRNSQEKKWERRNKYLLESNSLFPSSNLAYLQFTIWPCTLQYNFLLGILYDTIGLSLKVCSLEHFKLKWVPRLYVFLVGTSTIFWSGPVFSSMGKSWIGSIIPHSTGPHVWSNRYLASWFIHMWAQAMSTLAKSLCPQRASSLVLHSAISG